MRDLAAFLAFALITAGGGEMREHHKNCFTYVGHATVVINAGGTVIWTDPIFSERALVVPRLKPPGVKFEDAPTPDIVLISHAHYDHLDQATLRKIPVSATIIVPKKTKDLVEKVFGGEVIELGWWKSVERKGMKITSVPAKHHGMRFITDFHRGYSGYFVEKNGFKFYFAGDTAYFKGFREIREKLGSPDVALLPIGAYSPRIYMKYVHMNPEEAVKAFADLGAGYMIPIHWGTFRLSMEKPDEPLKRLSDRIKTLNLDGRVVILKHGERKCF